MKHRTSRLFTFSILSLLTASLISCASNNIRQQLKYGCGVGSGKVKDEALCVNRSAASFPAADEDYFADMDYGASKKKNQVAQDLEPYLPGISKTPDAAAQAIIKGRNNWIVWTGGNDRFWDLLSRESKGTVDLLKTLSNHPSLNYNRDNRWQYLGVVNEPCFNKGTGPRVDRYGLWLDTRDTACSPDPFENETKYPGVQIGARGVTVPVGSYYGYASGVVGLRLFPNPDFDENANKHWDPVRYYTDPSYYNDKDLVKPYRVGMSCGFCHVGPNPTNPPKDPENPSWANLNSNPGAQYFWVDRVLMWNVDKTNFPYQLFHTSRPGALDTSFISTDNINNPRTMNAVYNLGARLAIAKKFGSEKLAGGELNNRQLNDYVPASSPLSQFYRAPDTVWTPRVLKDGSDSVGALGALNRVFLNIGLFSEEWLEHFKPLIGGKPITPIEIAVAKQNSTYWAATEAQTPDLALFFLATAKPDQLQNAPGGKHYLTAKTKQLTHGKAVFAENCARCHSSKLPEELVNYFPNGGCNGTDYLKCWNNYWSWTKTAGFKAKMKQIVMAKDFLKDNYLSAEFRVPVTLLETNACAPLATNAIEGNIWDNFSSQSYKNLPSVGSIKVHHPISGKPWIFKMPAGGRGYSRVPSLISLWSTAPFLLNNTLGDFQWTGSVVDRMKSFDSAIKELLWPEKRKGNHLYQTANGKEIPGIIDVTENSSYLRVATGYLPDILTPLVGKDGIELGPIPKDTPINLIANLDLEKRWDRDKLLLKIIGDLNALPKNATDEEAKRVFADLVEPMLKMSKCPDFVVNRGHYFGTAYTNESEVLSDADKFALIEYLKTF